jgi:hypothetical protein
MWICEPLITHPRLADFSFKDSRCCGIGEPRQNFHRNNSLFLNRSGFRGADYFIAHQVRSESETHLIFTLRDHR